MTRFDFETIDKLEISFDQQKFELKYSFSVLNGFSGEYLRPFFLGSDFSDSYGNYTRYVKKVTRYTEKSQVNDVKSKSAV